MSELTPRFSLIIDADRPGGEFPLITAEGGAAAVPEWVVGDIFDLSLRFARLPAALGDAVEYLSLAGSWSIVAGLKASRLSTAGLIASAADFGLSSGGSYVAALSLNTAEALALMAAKTDAVDVWLDIQVADAGNTRRVTYQIQVTLNPQVYGVGETSPDPEEPEYPAPGAIPVRMVGSVAISVGAVSVAAAVAADRDYIPVPVVRKPLAADPDIFVLCTHSLDRDGFTATLSAAPDKEGYYLDYIAF